MSTEADPIVSLESLTGQAEAGSLRLALERTLSVLPLRPADAAAVALARALADELDSTYGDDRWKVMDKLTPRLLAVLGALGATASTSRTTGPTRVRLQEFVRPA